MSVNSAGVKDGTFRENYVDTLAADALAPCVARTSAAMVLVIVKGVISVIKNDR